MCILALSWLIGARLFFTQVQAVIRGKIRVEVFCHGGLSVIKSLSALFFDLGIREAGPGEFSRLAFENGKLTLNEAEAVADLIHSEDVERGILSSEAVAGKLSGLIRGLGDEVDEFKGLY
jgi:tRNA modification GTPase